MRIRSRPISPARLSAFKWITCFALLVIAILLGARNVTVPKMPISDYAAYWTASRLLLIGSNPYNAHQVLAFQKTIGWDKAMPLVMRNPPWAFSLVLPLGFFGYAASRMLWLLLQIAIVVVCGLWMWKIYGGSRSRRWVASVVAAAFVPSTLVLAIGQITPFLVLGVCGFLYCERNRLSNSWLQAASLVLVALKPQLLYLFWIALVLWIAQTRRWSLLLRFLAALTATTAIPSLIDPRLPMEYLAYIIKTPILMEPVPTLGNLLRLQTNIGFMQFAPTLLGVIWVFWYWKRHRSKWEWGDQMPAILLASLLTGAYSWFFDQVVLLPALICVMAQVSSSRNRVHLTAALALYFAVNAGVLVALNRGATLTNFGLVWTVPAWCVLFAILCSVPRLSTAGIAEPQCAFGGLR